MSVPTNSGPKQRIPLEVEGIQVNFCKNPNCANYGIPASAESQRGKEAKARGRDKYRVESGSYSHNRPGTPVITCLLCGERPPIKSNQGIYEEKKRISQYLAVREPSCPNRDCKNFGITDKKKRFHRHGPSAAGSTRYLCLGCNETFSINTSKPAKNHLLPHKNSHVFDLLVNLMPMRRICKVTKISHKTLYDKIRFLHRQAMAFVAHRERRLLNGELPLEKLYLSVDRQDHLVNWTNRKDKRQRQFHATGTADNTSSYVFGIHLNYDPSLDPYAVGVAAREAGDDVVKAPFRRYARLWLQSDYKPATAEKAVATEIRKDCGLLGLQHEIKQTYEEAAVRSDVEAFDLPAECTRFPLKGMQVHAEYTLYGHFFFLRELFKHVGKLRFYLDQESGIRAACLAAFQDRILARECDAFYVSINKTMTIDEKLLAMREVRTQIEEIGREYPYGLTDTSLRRMLIERALQSKRPIGPWRDMWVDVLSRITSEPEKKVCHLTNFNDYKDDHLAALMDKASLHGIDRFFAQIRNSLSLLARSPRSASNTGRIWYQKNAYDPEVVAMLLDIYRVNYNYLEVGKDKKTPAMRLGLARSAIRLTDILTFEASTKEKSPQL